MCGRFSLKDPSRLQRVFPRFRFPEFSETRLPALSPRYNIAPSQPVLGVRDDGHDVAELFQWGIHGRVNIRAESVAARRGPVRWRCVTFADGFYEWLRRKPVYYELRSREPFAFAGLYELRDDRPHCDVITCEPNALVARVHDRMPVILTPSAIELWLSLEPLPPEVAGSVLKPLDPALMTVREVGTRVNNANYDAPDVLEPDPEQITLGL